MPGNYSLLYVEAAGNTITAARRNAEHQQHIDKFEPQFMDDESANISAMRATVDPGESGSESLATSLRGELHRIRFALFELKQKVDPSLTYWYETPTTTLPSIPAVTVDNTVPRFNGTEGVMQNSNIVISDEDALTLNSATIATSGAGTTYTSTTVTDAAEWDLSNVIAGDIVEAGSSEGVVTSVDNGANEVTVASWAGGIPTDTTVATVKRRASLVMSNDTLVKMGSTTVFTVEGNNITNVNTDFADAITLAGTSVTGAFKAKQDFLYSGADNVRYHYYNWPSDVSQIVVEATAGGGGGGGTETTSGSEFVESAGGGGGAYFMKRLTRSDCTYDSHDFDSGDVNTVSDRISITLNGYVTGLPVRFTTTGTLPGGLSAGVTYYVDKAGVLLDDLEIHETQTGGPSNTPSSKVTLTDGGTGTHTIIPQEVFISFAVGKGGAGGLGHTTLPMSGAPGGTTSLFWKALYNTMTLHTLTANQGVGGDRDFATTSASFASGGASGTVTDNGSLADVKVNGEHGGPGFMPVGGIRARSGSGGRSFYGATARTYATAATVHGNFPGGGGGGVSAGNSTSGTSGGDGASGLVTIWEYY